MDIGGLIFILLIVGIVLAFVPVEGTIKNIIIGLIVIAVVIAVFHGFGGFGMYSPRHW